MKLNKMALHRDKKFYLLLLIIIIMIFRVFYTKNREKHDNLTAVEATDTTIIFRQSKKDLPIIDLEAIKRRGALIALTRYNSTSFFIYKGRPMGFEYELLKLFADDLGVDLQMKIAPNRDSLFSMLENGSGDLIAADLTITKDLAKRFAFSIPHSKTRQILVQRLPRNWRDMKTHNIEKKLIRDPLGLIGKTVTVRENSPYYKRLKNLSEEIGGDIKIDVAPNDMETERLIELVSEGAIQYTISDENVAKVNSSYYKNIDVKTPISFSQRVAWAFRKGSPNLQRATNRWLKKLRYDGKSTFSVIYNKYYNSKRQFKKRRSSDLFALHTGTISPYDSLFKKYSTDLFSWELLAAQAYQESHFDPTTTSWMGAVGLMQLLPETARMMGVSNIDLPENGIIAGVKYLTYIYDKYWSDLPDSEAVKFTLASYNAGPGHIKDAQRLAKLLGKAPNIWDENVATALLKLADRNYCYRKEVRNGYCRGREPYNYVEEILLKAHIYEGIIDNLESRNNEVILKTPTENSLDNLKGRKGN